MKKIFLFFLAALPLYLGLNFYFLDKYGFICPVAYQGDMIVRNDSRGNGYFAASRGNGSRIHEGIDLFAPIGTPVLACRAGIVIAARASRGMGNYVVIRHSGGITTIYGHLLKVNVRRGRLVRQGDVIGAVGKTGNASHPAIKPHLHFEVRRGGVPQDPLDYLP